MRLPTSTTTSVTAYLSPFFIDFIFPTSLIGGENRLSTSAPTNSSISPPTPISIAFCVSFGPGMDAYTTDGPFSDLNSFLLINSLSVQVTSPAPPAVGLSPISLIMYGLFLLFSARFKLSLKDATGPTNSNSSFTDQKFSARNSAPSVTLFLLSPVTMTTA